MVRNLGLIITLAAVAIIALAPAALAGRKGFYVQDYTFKKPMNGYTGRQGNYWCDYVKLPNRKCDANGNNCRITSWTLRQTCY